MNQMRFPVKQKFKKQRLSLWASLPRQYLVLYCNNLFSKQKLVHPFKFSWAQREKAAFLFCWHSLWYIFYSLWSRLQHIKLNFCMVPLRYKPSALFLDLVKGFIALSRWFNSAGFANNQDWMIGCVCLLSSVCTRTAKIWAQDLWIWIQTALPLKSSLILFCFVQIFSTWNGCFEWFSSIWWCTWT